MYLLLYSVYNLQTYSYIYSIPYLCLGLLVIFIGWDWIFGRRAFDFPDKRLLLLMFFFLLFFGLRWFMFSDMVRYYEVYSEVNPKLSLYSNYQSLPFVDIGFLFIIIVAKSIGLDFFVFIFLNSLFDFSLLYFCIKRYSVNPPLTCLFFLAFQGILIECNMLRNIKAMLIFLWSLKYVEERKLIKFSLCQIVSATMHMSSILYLPLYWFINKRWDMKYVLLVSVASIIFYLFATDLFENIFKSILVDFVAGEGKAALIASHIASSKESVISIGSIERIFFLLLTLIMYRKINLSSRALLFCNMYLLYFALFSIFGFNFYFRDRVPTLFIMAYWFLPPYLINTFKERYSFLKICLIILAFMKIFASTRMCTAYYETVFFHKYTMEQRQILDEKLIE